MFAYLNLSGQSGIAAYDYGETYVKVRFKTGGIYLYSYESTGPGPVEYMKTLAERGYGLNKFINSVVRNNYALHVRED